MKLATLHDLFVNELRDLYDAENQLMKVLPKMAKVAASIDLRTVIETHLTETEAQIVRLESMARQLNLSLRGKKCRAMEGLVLEAAEVIECDGCEAVKDAALIAAAQRAEHYEMAGYGTARTYAELLDFEEAASLLQEILDEETVADKTLTVLAQSINIDAMTAS